MNKRTSFPAAFALVTSLVLPVCSWAENEIGFIEKFALAPDRAKVLGELVPGTEDYYFFPRAAFPKWARRGEARGHPRAVEQAVSR